MSDLIGDVFRALESKQHWEYGVATPFGVSVISPTIRGAAEIARAMRREGSECWQVKRRVSNWIEVDSKGMGRSES